ncbi:MAG TPA: SDR family oxidoreductase [Phycisphaerae bacterium]
MPQSDSNEARPASRQRKVVLVTGCSSGIGRATVKVLAQRGHLVYATARRPESVAELQNQFSQAEGHVVACSLDVTDPHSLDAVAQRVQREHGKLDVLVNNAGYGEFGAVEDVPIEQWRQQFETNVFGIVRTTQTFLPLLRAAGEARRAARLIIVSSAVAHMTTPLMGTYNASKHATRSVAAALRMELARWGIDVIEIEPGFIATSFRANVQQHIQQTPRRTPFYQDAYAAFEARWQRLTSGKLAQPLEVANAIRQAVEARRPRACYRVTLAAKMVPVLALLMPRRALAWATLRIFGLRSTLGRRIRRE